MGGLSVLSPYHHRLVSGRVLRLSPYLLIASCAVALLVVARERGTSAAAAAADKVVAGGVAAAMGWREAHGHLPERRKSWFHSRSEGRGWAG